MTHSTVLSVTFVTGPMASMRDEPSSLYPGQPSSSLHTHRQRAVCSVRAHVTGCPRSRPTLYMMLNGGGAHSCNKLCGLVHLSGPLSELVSVTRMPGQLGPTNGYMESYRGSS